MLESTGIVPRPINADGSRLLQAMLEPRYIDETIQMVRERGALSITNDASDENILIAFTLHGHSKASVYRVREREDRVPSRHMFPHRDHLDDTDYAPRPGLSVLHYSPDAPRTEVPQTFLCTDGSVIVGSIGAAEQLHGARWIDDPLMAMIRQLGVLPHLNSELANRLCLDINAELAKIDPTTQQIFFNMMVHRLGDAYRHTWEPGGALLFLNHGPEMHGRYAPSSCKDVGHLTRYFIPLE